MRNYIKATRIVARNYQRIAAYDFDQYICLMGCLNNLEGIEDQSVLQTYRDLTTAAQMRATNSYALARYYTTKFTYHLNNSS